MNQPNPNFLAFLRAWLESNLTEARCSELLPLAIAAGVRFGNATTEHGKAIELGRQLQRAIKAPAGEIRVEFAKLTPGGPVYRLSKDLPRTESTHGKEKPDGPP